jgi:hypothetical protein
MESAADSAEDVAELTVLIQAAIYSRTSLLGQRSLVAKDQLGWQVTQRLFGDDDDEDFVADCLKLPEKTDCQSLVVSLAAAHLFVDRQEAIG